MKPLLLVVRRPDSWEKAIARAQEEVRSDREVTLLFLGEAVTRCPRCEPGLFRQLHQFVLDGGRAAVCVKSLKTYGIPESRPPEVFERVADGQALLGEFSGEVVEI